MNATFQHGFIKHRSSTTTIIFVFTQFISSAIDNQSQIDVLYSEFLKALYKLAHSILCQFGHSSHLIQFLRSDLSVRWLFLYYNGYASNEVVALSGVPLGYILKPLFFNLYIIDIINELPVNCLLYTDDLKNYAISSQSDCMVLQDDLHWINAWPIENKLLLNADKI